MINFLDDERGSVEIKTQMFAILSNHVCTLDWLDPTLILSGAYMDLLVITDVFWWQWHQQVCHMLVGSLYQINHDLLKHRMTPSQSQQLVAEAAPASRYHGTKGKHSGSSQTQHNTAVLRPSRPSIQLDVNANVIFYFVYSNPSWSFVIWFYLSEFKPFIAVFVQVLYTHGHILNTK